MAARVDELLASAEALLAALDHMDGDPDLEPVLGAAENHPRPSWWYVRDEDGSQVDWAHGNRDDREDTDEDGGDILDEPHGDAREDDEDNGDKEPSMGWGIPGQRVGARGLNAINSGDAED